MEVKQHWNQKVAKSRGLEWRKKLLLGRLDVHLHPTKIRLKRIHKNITQIEIAEAIGMSYTTYGAVESGRRPVSEDRAKKISRFLTIQFDKAFKPAQIGKNRFTARK